MRFRLLILFMTAALASSCCSRRPLVSDEGARVFANAFAQMGAAVVTSAMESGDLSGRLQEFYRQHDRWPTNGVEFAAFADPQGTTNTTTRLGEFVLTPLSDGRLEASLVRTTSVSRVVVERPRQQ